MRGRIGVVVSALIFLLVLVSPPPLQGAIPTTERQALIALYDSTAGDSWTTRTNWRNGTDTDFNAVGTECTWYGVTCTGDSVTAIEFVYNNLAGTLPPEIGQLTGLQTLKLSANLLTGPIPSEIGNLPALVILYLDNNNFDPDHPAGLTGAIPASLGDLSNLQELNLWDNRLSGAIPAELGNLSALQKLRLDQNQLDGEIPPALGNLSGLVEMDLGDNSLTGSIPSELGNLGSLNALALDNNVLTGAIPAELGDLTSLGSLILYSNRLSGTIPTELGNFPALYSLSLSYNSLEGSIPSSLGSLSTLMILELKSNKLSGEIPTELENLSNLNADTGLSLDWNALETSDGSLITFINSKSDGNWQSNQTIPPTNISVSSISDHSVWVNWDVVDYISDPGGYRVYSRASGDSAWTLEGVIPSKATHSAPVSGLEPAGAYDFTVRTFTEPHFFNENEVLSDLGVPAAATTTNVGCAAPEVSVVQLEPGVNSWQLTVTTAFSSYQWSTGETTQQILVSPTGPTRYWVLTTEASCQETVALELDPDCLFNDGFEDGTTDSWSSGTP